MTIAAPTNQVAPFSRSSASRPNLEGRFRLAHVSDAALHAGVKTLAGRYNVLTADLLAHLAEVEARGIYRERACSSLYTYCVYELRLSEDEAQRRTKAARTAREFPVLFEMLAEGAIHLTGLLLLAPYLTRENYADLLARARFRTKREIEHLVAEIAPRPDVPARIEPLGPRRVANLWQAYAASLRGAVRELAPGVTAGDAPPVVLDESNDVEPATRRERGYGDDAGSMEALSKNVSGAQDGLEIDGGVNDAIAEHGSAPERVSAPGVVASQRLQPQRYRVEFTASARYVELLEEARNLLQHRVPDRDVARVHELAMEALVAELRKRRRAGRRFVVDRSAPERVKDSASERSAPEQVKDGASERSAPERVARGARERSAPERVKDGASERSAPELVVGGLRERSAPAQAAGTGNAPAPALAKRYVPAGLKRAVWQRDEGRCTFEDAGGRRCREHAGLEIHHQHAFALGGATTLANLRLLCRAHNALLAERDFGREHVERMKHALGGTEVR